MSTSSRGDCPRRVLLANSEIVIQDADVFRPNVDIVIEGNQIFELTERGAKNGAYFDVVDCSGLLLMPGMVNSHTHLFQVLTRALGKESGVREWAKTITYPAARQLGAKGFYSAAMLACVDAIRNGSTCLVDHATHFARFHAGESSQALLDSGLRGAVARGGSDFSRVDQGEVRCANDDLKETEEFLVRWPSTGRVRGWVGPSGFHSCSAEALREFKELAKAKGTRYHLHLAESREGLAEAKEAGFLGEVHWAHDLGLLDEESSFAHAVWVSEEEIQMLSREQCYVVHCPSSNQLLASGVAPIRQMLSSNIRLALATDGASSNDSMDMIAEMKTAALLARVSSLDPGVIQARDVFYAATEGGARLMGYDNLGKIAPGYLADVVGVRLHNNPSLTPCNAPLETLVFCASGRDVSFVMVDGVVLLYADAFTRTDIGRVIAEVKGIASELRLSS